MTGAPTEEEIRAGFHRTTQSVEGAKSAMKGDKTQLKENGGVKQLRSLVDRIVQLEEGRSGIAGDIKDIYEEAKSAGWSKKAVRIVVKREMEDAEARAAREAVEQEADAMLSALGDFASSPLGESAVQRAKH